MTRPQKTNRIHVYGLVALAGLVTACAPTHHGQSRYGVEVLANSSQPALRPSCNTYVQPCGLAPAYTGYYVEQFAYVPQMVPQPLPEPPVVVMQAPVETVSIPTPPIYVEPPAPIVEPAFPTYTPSEPYWPESEAPVPTWTPLRK